MAAGAVPGGAALDTTPVRDVKENKGDLGAWALTGFLGLGGALGYALAGWSFEVEIFSNYLVWIFAVTFCLAEIFTVDLPFQSHRHSYSMAEVPAVLGLFFLAPGELAVAAVAGMTAAFFFYRRQSGLKLAFNMCLQLASIVVLMVVFESLAQSRVPTDPSAIVAAYVGVAVVAVLSHIAVFAVIAFVEGMWDRILFSRGLWFGIATQLSTASLGVIGVLLVDLDWRAIIILLTPVAVIYAAYHSLGGQVRAEEKLRVSELKFGALIQASSDVTALVRPDLTLEYVSDAARDVLGIEPIKVLGKDAWVMFGAGLHDQSEFGKHLHRARTSSEPVAFDITTKHTDGTDVQLEVNITNLLKDPGVGALLMSIRNVTDRRRLEDRLTQSQKMDAIGQLAGGIAHDFNNLLAVIQNYANFVKDDLPPESAGAQDLDEIVSATQTAATLTQQLLSFARKEVVSPKIVCVNDVVSSVHRMLSRTIEESIELRTSLGSEVPYVKTDQGRLEQVLINLAVNAKDAMPDGGSLVLRTSSARVGPALASDDLPEGDYAVLTVEDTGEGIPPAVRERIFEPFFTTKSKGDGTGLGLATVYGIVKQFRGHIEVESEVGSGSTFRIYLPGVEGSEVDEAEPSTVPALAGNGTILVAEDSEPLRKLVRRILSNNSYSVIEAQSGAEAFKLWQEHTSEIDLLVTDVVMPRMSGRELSEATGLPTVFVSGYTDEIISQDDMGDCSFFVQKPFSSAELLSVVAEALTASTAQPTR